MSALFCRLPKLRGFGARSLRLYLLCMCVCGPLGSFAWAAEADWIRPQHSGDPLIWGRRDGIVFGLPSTGGMKGPRGLIRVGVIPPGESNPQVLNYIAIEPVVAGPGSRSSRMAFSELEASVLDPGERGKRLWVAPVADASSEAWRGDLRTLHVGHATVERLSVRVDVEPYTANGAEVYLVVSIDSDHPEELRISVFGKSDSPPLDELTVTATMGNYERLRLLWLKDRVVDSRKLFSSYEGDAFVELNSYAMDQMLRSRDGDAIVYATSSEPDPQTTAGNNTAHWPYLLPRFTQYWRIPAHDLEPDLRVRVNARRVYWQSKAPVLGGIAFENFEVQERYVAGQTFVFGISQQQPWQLDPELDTLEKTLAGSSDDQK
jgi:hypothetical protein